MEENKPTQEEEISSNEDNAVKTETNIYKEISLLCLSLLVLGLVLFPQTKTDKMPSNVVAFENNTKEVFENPFEEISIDAKSAYVLDLNTDEAIFSLNENVQLPLASLTKVMTALTALESTPSHTVIKIQLSDLRSEGDSGLLVDERWTLKDLIDFSLVTSSNDGALAISSSVGSNILGTEGKRELGREEFIKRMNSIANNLDLSNTYFLNESGLDENLNVSGGYSTAREIAELFGYSITKYREDFKQTTVKDYTALSLNNIPHEAQNTNQYVDNIPMLIGSKTGFTDLAGGNLVIAFNAGLSKPIVVSVMGSTIDGRFSDAEKLVFATLKYIQTKQDE